MEYLKVKWHHHYPDEPTQIYNEINEDRWEIRKVEVFADGSSTYASPFYQTGQTWLAEAPLPSLAEINADSQFEGEVISRHEFERIWLMSSEMIILHEPHLVQIIQKVAAQKHLKLNEFVQQAVQRYLDLA